MRTVERDRDRECVWGLGGGARYKHIGHKKKGLVYLKQMCVVLGCVFEVCVCVLT